ncbi:MAG: hypothetical protein B7Y01_01765, partial [Xanthobacter sp. 17-67-6]
MRRDLAKTTAAHRLRAGARGEARAALSSTGARLKARLDLARHRDEWQHQFLGLEAVHGDAFCAGADRLDCNRLDQAEDPHRDAIGEIEHPRTDRRCREIRGLPQRQDRRQARQQLREACIVLPVLQVEGFEPLCQLRIGQQRLAREVCPRGGLRAGKPGSGRVWMTSSIHHDKNVHTEEPAMRTLQIRDERARVLAEQLAARRKVTMTEAVIQALEGELTREKDKEPLASRLK